MTIGQAFTFSNDPNDLRIGQEGDGGFRGNSTSVFGDRRHGGNPLVRCSRTTILAVVAEPDRWW
jgi:hypothetical protein